MVRRPSACDGGLVHGQLREGFDVHHIDNDHGNDDPLNLVLIEHSDHQMLHSGKHRLLRGTMRPVGWKERQAELKAFDRAYWDAWREDSERERMKRLPCYMSAEI